MSDSQEVKNQLETIQQTTDIYDPNYQEAQNQGKRRRKRRNHSQYQHKEVYDIPSYIIKAYASLITQKPLLKGRRIHVTQRGMHNKSTLENHNSSIITNIEQAINGRNSSQLPIGSARHNKSIEVDTSRFKKQNKSRSYKKLKHEILVNLQEKAKNKPDQLQEQRISSTREDLKNSSQKSLPQVQQQQLPRIKEVANKHSSALLTDRGMLDEANKTRTSNMHRKRNSALDGTYQDSDRNMSPNYSMNNITHGDLNFKTLKSLQKTRQQQIPQFQQFRVSNDLERATKRMRRLTMEDKRAKKKEEELSERRKQLHQLPKIPIQELNQKLIRMKYENEFELQQMSERTKLTKFLQEESVRHQRMLNLIQKVKNSQDIKVEHQRIEEQIRNMELELLTHNVQKRNNIKAYLEDIAKKKVKKYKEKKIEKTLKEKQKSFVEESNLIITKGKQLKKVLDLQDRLEQKITQRNNNRTLTPLNQSKTQDNYSVKYSEKTNQVPNLMKKKDVKKENIDNKEFYQVKEKKEEPKQQPKQDPKPKEVPKKEYQPKQVPQPQKEIKQEIIEDKIGEKKEELKKELKDQDVKQESEDQYTYYDEEYYEDDFEKDELKKSQTVSKNPPSRQRTKVKVEKQINPTSNELNTLQQSQEISEELGQSRAQRNSLGMTQEIKESIGDEDLTSQKQQ